MTNLRIRTYLTTTWVQRNGENPPSGTFFKKRVAKDCAKDAI